MHRWVARTTWFAGVGVFLVEMSASVHYLQAGLEKHTTDLLCLMPTAAMLTVKLLGHVAENVGSIEYGMRMLPLAALPFALLVAGLLLERRAEQ